MINIILMFFPILVFSQSGRDIAEMIENRPAPDDLINQTVMILTNSEGKTRTHKMISKSKNTCIEDKKLQGKVLSTFINGVELFKC